MILDTMAGLSLVLSVSLNPTAHEPAMWSQLSTPQKQAALLPLVRRATDCIARTVAASPSYRADMRPDEINELIVDSIATCGRPVRAMMDAYDQLYGDGSGEAFLIGPYLDVLPSAVVGQIRAKAPAH